MLTRKGIYFEARTEPAPVASATLERDGFTLLPAVFDAGETQALREACDAVYAEFPADGRSRARPPEEDEDFRYEMLNRSAEAQLACAKPEILAVIDPLLGEDCHVIANTCWRNPPREANHHGGGNWHIDSGPHVPRPAGVPWDPRIPYPVFAVGCHIFLADCPLENGPTGFLRGSHTSGQAPPLDRLQDADLTYEGNGPVVLPAHAGDVVLFVSDVWHRRMPSAPGAGGRYFLQVHYGRRDIAQRIRTTSRVNHLSSATRRRSRDRRMQRLMGLHPPLFYDG